MNTAKLKELFETSTDKYGDAEKIGVSYETMRKIANGGDFKVSTLELIAKYYKVPVGYFFDESDAKGHLTHQIEIAKLKGQIKGMREAINRLGLSLKGIIIDDN